jgi:hypothetical protein
MKTIDMHKLQAFWETFPFKLQTYLCLIAISGMFFASCLFYVIHMAQFNPYESNSEHANTVAQQMSHCWTIPREDERGTPNVHLLLSMNPDASVQNAQVAGIGKKYYDASDAYRKASADAISALKACGQQRFLLKDKYESWKQLEVTLEPHRSPI